MTDIKFGGLSSSEVEHRRNLSVTAYEEIKKDDFNRWYQELCDSEYWKFGQRCSGCDFWASYAGRSGECQRGGKISGVDVLRSAGIVSSSYRAAPGYPFTKSDEWCPSFKDEFDWEALELEYLIGIGAMQYGKLRDKPKRRHSQ